MKPGKIVAFARSMVLPVGLSAALPSETDCILSSRDDDHGMVNHAPGCGIEKAGGSDDDNLCRGLCCCRKDARAKKGGCEKNKSALQDASGPVCRYSAERTLFEARKCRSRHCDRNQCTDLKIIFNNTEFPSSGKITPRFRHCQDNLHAICIQFELLFELRHCGTQPRVGLSRGGLLVRVGLISSTPETLRRGAAETRAPRTVSHRQRMWKR